MCVCLRERERGKEEKEVNKRNKEEQKREKQWSKRESVCVCMRVCTVIHRGGQTRAGEGARVAHRVEDDGVSVVH